MRRDRRWPQAGFSRLGVAVALICGALPFATAALARMVPVAASDAKAPAPPRPAAIAASAATLGDPPGMGSPQCEGLVAEVRQACIEQTASRRR